MPRRPREVRAVAAEITYWWRLVQRCRRGSATPVELAAEDAMNAALDRWPMS